MKQIKLVMDEERAILLSRACETIARLGMSQFKELCEMMRPMMSWDEKTEIENYLKGRLTPKLSSNEFNSMNSKECPEECQIAWDAYQHIRREISWNKVGKDWRTDQRDWHTMMTVNYDEPFKASSLAGDFKTERIE